MSDSGSERGPENCAQVRLGAVIMSQRRRLTCRNVGYLAACLAAFFVVVLGVAGSLARPSDDQKPWPIAGGEYTADDPCSDEDRGLYLRSQWDKTV
jgi:hypothetical protein